MFVKKGNKIIIVVAISNSIRITAHLYSPLSGALKKPRILEP